MNESALTRNIIRKIRLEFGDRVFCYKVSDRFQKGLPDIFGILDGIGFGIEIKMPGAKPDPKREEIQKYNIEKIKKAGGKSLFGATSAKEVLSWIKSFTDKEGRI